MKLKGTSLLSSIFIESNSSIIIAGQLSSEYQFKISPVFSPVLGKFFFTMFFFFISTILSSIEITTYDEVMNRMTRSPCFILAISPDTFNYVTVINTFRSVIRNLNTKQQFYIVHANEQLTNQLNLTSLPALVPFYNTKQSKPFYGSFSYSSLYDFLGIHSASAIPYIDNKDDLEHFYLTSASGLIVVSDDPVDKIGENNQVIVDFYYNHFNEISVAFASTKLFERPGYYIYRFLDDTLESLPDLTNCTLERLQEALFSAYPKVTRFDARAANYYEGDKEIFGIFLFNMSDSIYLNKQQLDLVLEARKVAGFNMTYLNFDMNPVLNVRYGFDENPKESFFIIDSKDSLVKKYQIDGELNTQNVLNFCVEFKEGKARRFWKSGKIPDFNIFTNLTEITSSELVEFTQKPFSVLGICYSSDDSLKNMTIAAEKINKMAPKIEFAKYSIAFNDWPIEETSFLHLPRVLIFQKGKLVENQQSSNPEIIVSNIMEVYNKADKSEL
ncbi:hypothetical protein TRFO_27833 [Tritrichomonas foetus]|uniref:Thioredoxin domain-containing protein n=1 Tax=Tritrichomonas foetus TaxID=1144522 RepID=A0A1J4K1G2_9EUKA|nr:hypothetical protein TRFO_27833 [Tritrichomonas foetus]|eukprot:OHT04624.1 hypothetical protein TRFO_27833 [Tritrichomonas foetus]